MTTLQPAVDPAGPRRRRQGVPDDALAGTRGAFAFLGQRELVALTGSFPRLGNRAARTIVVDDEGPA